MRILLSRQAKSTGAPILALYYFVIYTSYFARVSREGSLRSIDTIRSIELRLPSPINVRSWWRTIECGRGCGDDDLVDSDRRRPFARTRTFTMSVNLYPHLTIMSVQRNTRAPILVTIGIGCANSSLHRRFPSRYADMLHRR